MKKTALSIVSVVSILLVSESVLAAASIKTRIQKQESRIQKGCDKGQITTSEEKTLKNEQKNIKKMIEKLSQGHSISSESKKKVHTALNRASINIFKKRYNSKSKPQEKSK
jgi:kynurenine formamidase